MRCGGKASIVAPLSGLYPVVSIPIAVLLLGDQLSNRQTLAIALALAAVVMLSYQSEPAEPSVESSGPQGERAP